MSKYRGSKGAAVHGGAVVGSPLVQGAVAQSETSATFDGASFNGVVRPGDKFTVAGDAQEYTIVTGGAVGATTPNEIDVTFSPGVVPGGGWADNAAVTFASNSMAQVTAWDGTFERPFIDGTVMGDDAQTGGLDTPKASGRVTALFDYGDAKQKAFVDDLKANAEGQALALMLVVAAGKQFWGDVSVTRGAVVGRRGAYFEVTFDWESEGAWAKNWN